MTNTDIEKISIKYGEQYINEKFKSKDLVEVHLAANGAAHGFYMGYKAAKNDPLTPPLYLRAWWWVSNLFFSILDILFNRPLPEPMDPPSMAAYQYMKKKGLTSIPTDHRAILTSALKDGFRAGVKQGAVQ